MACRIFFTLAALLLALGAVLGGAPTGGGPFDLTAVVCLFVAVITWYDWDTIREGFDRRVNFALIRVAPLIGMRPDRGKRD